jgi:hypothetical protein
MDSIYKKDDKIVELKCSVDVRVPSTMVIYTESEYTDLKNRRYAEEQQKVTQRRLQDQLTLKNLGL